MTGQQMMSDREIKC